MATEQRPVSLDMPWPNLMEGMEWIAEYAEVCSGEPLDTQARFHQMIPAQIPVGVMQILLGVIPSIVDAAIRAAVEHPDNRSHQAVARGVVAAVSLAYLALGGEQMRDDVRQRTIDVIRDHATRHPHEADEHGPQIYGMDGRPRELPGQESQATNAPTELPPAFRSLLDGLLSDDEQ